MAGKRMLIRVRIPQRLGVGEVRVGTDVAEVVPHDGVSVDELRHLLWQQYAEPVIVEIDEEEPPLDDADSHGGGGS